MSAPRLIGPLPPTATGRASRTRQRTLPADLLSDASRLLGILSLVGAALWIVGTLLWHAFMYRFDSQWSRWQSSDALAVAGAGMSVALFVYTRRTRHDPRVILDL